MLEVDYGAFTNRASLFPDGWYGFALACVILSFATGGAQYISGSAARWNIRSDLPRAIIGATALAAVFFTLVSIVAVGVLSAKRRPGGRRRGGAVDTAAGRLHGLRGRCGAVRTGDEHQLDPWATKSVLIACKDGWLPEGIAVNARFGTPHFLLTGLLVLGAAPILAGWDLRYIIMLGGGLVFVYDLIPLWPRRLPERLPEVFARASMPMSALALKRGALPAGRDRCAGGPFLLRRGCRRLVRDYLAGVTL